MSLSLSSPNKLLWQLKCMGLFLKNSFHWADVWRTGLWSLWSNADQIPILEYHKDIFSGLNSFLPGPGALNETIPMYLEAEPMLLVKMPLLLKIKMKYRRKYRQIVKRTNEILLWKKVCWYFSNTVSGKAVLLQFYLQQILTSCIKAVKLY